MTYRNCMLPAQMRNLRNTGKCYLLKLVGKAQGNIVPKLNLTEIYIRNGETDKAVEQLEIIHKQFPEFPKEAVDYYDKTLVLLKKRIRRMQLFNLQFSIII